jgi:hypothetical protein
MAVPISNVTRRIVFVASGTGPYAFTFEILAETDIAVYKDDTLLTLTTDYSVSINANGTGSVTLVISPVGATQIAIVGDRAIERISDFVTGGDFFANTVNDEFDSLTIFAQQNSEAVSRALIAPQTDPTTINMTLPRKADRANKYLAFDSDGNPAPGDTAVEVAAIASISDEIEAVAGISTEIVAVDAVIDQRHHGCRYCSKCNYGCRYCAQRNNCCGFRHRNWHSCCKHHRHSKRRRKC